MLFVSTPDDAGTFGEYEGEAMTPSEQPADERTHLIAQLDAMADDWRRAAVSKYTSKKSKDAFRFCASAVEDLLARARGAVPAAPTAVPTPVKPSHHQCSGCHDQVFHYDAMAAFAAAPPVDADERETFAIVLAEIQGDDWRDLHNHERDEYRAEADKLTARGYRRTPPPPSLSEREAHPFIIGDEDRAALHMAMFGELCLTEDERMSNVVNAVEEVVEREVDRVARLRGEQDAKLADECEAVAASWMTSPAVYGVLTRAASALRGVRAGTDADGATDRPTA